MDDYSVNHIKDIYTDKYVKLKRTRKPTRVPEGVYEGAIDRYYGYGEPLPQSLKEKYGFEYGFITPNDRCRYEIFGHRNGQYYFFELEHEDIVFDEDLEEKRWDETEPKSNRGKDVMDWLFEGFCQEFDDQMLIGLAQVPEIRQWLVDFWDWIHDIDHNAATAEEVGTWGFRHDLLDITGLEPDEYVFELLSAGEPPENWDSRERDLIQRRAELQMKYSGSDIKSSRDRKGKVWRPKRPIFGFRLKSKKPKRE